MHSYALCLWSPLQRVENRDLFTEGSTWLEDTERDIFSQHGWQHDLRIGPLYTCFTFCFSNIVNFGLFWMFFFSF
jgi:hypothetical protein